jgi:hypothetical protein
LPASLALIKAFSMLLYPLFKALRSNSGSYAPACGSKDVRLLLNVPRLPAASGLQPGLRSGRAYGTFDYRLTSNCQNFKTVNARHGGLAAGSSGYSNWGIALIARI